MKRNLPSSPSTRAFSNRSLRVIATAAISDALIRARRYVLLLRIAILAVGIVSVGVPASTVGAAPGAVTHGQPNATLLGVAQRGAVLLAIDVEAGTSTVIGNTGRWRLLQMGQPRTPSRTRRIRPRHTWPGSIWQPAQRLWSEAIRWGKPCTSWE